MESITLNEHYSGLSKAQLLDKAYELGVNYTKHSYDCSQSTVKTLHEILGFNDVLVKAATSLCGGTALQMVGTCGALAGGIMVLDNYFGRSPELMSSTTLVEENLQPIFTAAAIAKELYDKYVEEFGSIQCVNVMTKVFGRPFYFPDPDELNKIEEAGAHTDPEKCGRIVGNVAQWVLEILINKEAIKVSA